MDRLKSRSVTPQVFISRPTSINPGRLKRVNEFKYAIMFWDRIVTGIRSFIASHTRQGSPRAYSTGNPKSIRTRNNTITMIMLELKAVPPLLHP